MRGKAFYNQGNLLDAANCFETALITETATAQSFSDLLLSLNYLPEYETEPLFNLHRKFDARYCQALTKTVSAHTNIPDPDRRIRIGYVSPDLRAHAVVFFIAPVLMQHDWNRFEIFAYYNHQDKDVFTNNIHKYCNHWRDIAGLSDDEVNNIIRKDEIDILIDLAGHSAYNRLLVFAKKPAPIQITWLGYPNTTGLSSIDYRFTDTLTDPRDTDDQYHTEILYRLPKTFLCYSPLLKCPDPSPLPAEKNGYVTFASLNNFAKLNSETIVTWIHILQEIPRSRLVLIFNGGSKKWLDNAVKKASCCSEIPLFPIRTMANLLYAKKAFKHSGIDSDRVTILRRSPNHAVHLQHYHNVDIALDPFPYNGTTTTLESFWMGVPVISLEGSRHAARVSAGISRNLGLGELVSNSKASYVDIARELAMNKRKLASLRANLRNTMSGSCIMAAGEFTRNLESAYQTMWRNWCRSQGN